MKQSTVIILVVVGAIALGFLYFTNMASAQNGNGADAGGNGEGPTGGAAPEVTGEAGG